MRAKNRRRIPADRRQRDAEQLAHSGEAAKAGTPALPRRRRNCLAMKAATTIDCYTGDAVGFSRSAFSWMYGGLATLSLGLKIPVSAVRFRPWALV
jgi:hypothetical protein